MHVWDSDMCSLLLSLIQKTQVNAVGFFKLYEGNVML